MTMPTPLRLLARLAAAAMVAAAAATTATAQPAPQRAATGAAAATLAPAPANAGAPTDRAFDIESARAMARELARSGELGLARPHNPLSTSYSAQSVLRGDAQLGRAIGGAARPSCMNAYAPMGILAIIPLLIDTVRDSGCKW